MSRELLRRVLNDNHACGHTTPETLNAIEAALTASPQAAPEGEWTRDVIALLDELLADRTVRLRFSDEAFARIARLRQQAASPQAQGGEARDVDGNPCYPVDPGPLWREDKPEGCLTHLRSVPGCYSCDERIAQWQAKAATPQRAPGVDEAMVERLATWFTRNAQVKLHRDGRATTADDYREHARAALEAALASGPSGVDCSQLWCLHIEGPDEVHAAPSWEHAQKAADLFNAAFSGPSAQMEVTMRAEVAPWPHSAASHAKDVGRFIVDWLIPRWQLKALAAAPAAQDQGEGNG